MSSLIIDDYGFHLAFKNGHTLDHIKLMILEMADSFA